VKHWGKGIGKDFPPYITRRHAKGTHTTLCADYGGSQKFWRWKINWFWKRRNV